MKTSVAQVGDVHAAFFGQPVPGRNDEGQLVAENLGRGQLRFARHKRDHPQIQPVIQNLRGHVAREGSPHGDVHLGIELPVAHQDRQQRVDGAFVDAQGEFAAAAAAQILHGALDFLAQIEHALGVARQQLSGVGELA